MQIECPTDIAVLLLAVRDERGLLRFPDEGSAARPGLTLTVKPLLAIAEQLAGLASKALSAPTYVRIDIIPEFSDSLPGVGELKEDATLYIAAASAYQASPAQTAAWPTLPDLLRRMPKDRNRLAYMRAFQVLSGSLTQDIKAYEFNDKGEIKRD